jgi:hypothetical protein
LRYRRDQQLELIGKPLHRLGVAPQNRFPRTQPRRIGNLAGRGREYGDVRPARHGQLQRHVAQTAEPDDAHVLAGLQLPVLHRRESRDRGAQQWRGSRQVRPRWNADHEALGDDDLLGIAAKGVSAVHTIGRVVSQGVAVEAVLLEIRQAVLADAAGVNHSAHTADVADLELGYRAAHRLHSTDDFVPGDAGIAARPPFAASNMDVGMANPAIQHIQQHVVWTDGAALDLQRSQRTGGAGGP